ncbi:TIP41-like protein [Lucilia cuprina]|nr:TIP41-like protein [Lucilia cuprina]
MEDELIPRLPVDQENIDFQGWHISYFKSHILKSICKKGQDEFCKPGEDEFCELCTYRHTLDLPHLPDMVFHKNKLSLTHVGGAVLEFLPMDALRRVENGKQPLQVACAQEWKGSSLIVTYDISISINQHTILMPHILYCFEVIEGCSIGEHLKLRRFQKYTDNSSKNNMFFLRKIVFVEKDKTGISKIENFLKLFDNTIFGLLFTHSIRPLNIEVCQRILLNQQKNNEELKELRAAKKAESKKNLKFRWDLTSTNHSKLRPESLMEEKFKPFDWTFTTDYQGTANDKFRVEKTDQQLNKFKLMQREKILFYHDLTLFEDELHDNGISSCSVKIRVMPSGFFILLRNFLRVDNVLLKIHDTRFHYEIENNYIFKEFTKRAATYEELKNVPPPYFTMPNEIEQHMPIKEKEAHKLYFK